MAEVTKQFAGLPLGLLICGPIIEVAKGQAELCRVYLDTLFKLTWKDGKPENPVNLVTFKLERPVTDGAGNITKQDIEVNAPLVSLVPVPAFTMNEVTVTFSMEVREAEVDKSSTEEKGEFSAGFSYWGFHSSVSGSVATKSEHQRTTDQSAKYDIFAKAIQPPAAEGMAKLTTVFASVIEPIPAAT